MFEQKPMLLSKDFKATVNEIDTTVVQQEPVLFEEPDYLDFIIYDGLFGKFNTRLHNKRENALVPGYYYALLIQPNAGTALFQLLDATSEAEAYSHGIRAAKDVNLPMAHVDVFYCIEAGVKDAVVLWGSPYTEAPTAVTFEPNGNLTVRSIH